jgi:hypothetical protein
MKVPDGIYSYRGVAWNTLTPTEREAILVAERERLRRQLEDYNQRWSEFKMAILENYAPVLMSAERIVKYLSKIMPRTKARRGPAIRSER